MDKQLLADLIQFNGIETAFTDAWGNATEVAGPDQLKLLTALGFATDNETLARQQLEQRQKQHWLEPLDPVSVQTKADSYLVQVRLPIDDVHTMIDLILTTEAGEVHQFSFTAIDAELTGAMVFDDEEYQQYDYQFSLPLPLGYHQLVLQLADDQDSFVQSLIITPERCFQPAQFQQTKTVGRFSTALWGEVRYKLGYRRFCRSKPLGQLSGGTRCRLCWLKSDSCSVPGHA